MKETDKQFNNINTEVTESNSFTQNYKVSARSNFNNWPNFEVGYKPLLMIIKTEEFHKLFIQIVLLPMWM